jgi:hypothetical protein
MKNRSEIPDLRELLNLRKDEIKTELNCVSLGTIQTFYPDTQTADITINFKRIISGDTPRMVDYPVLINCPAVILTGGQGGLMMPIAQGDHCVVLFCDRDMDTWHNTGSIDKPNSSRAHDISDGIALVGISSLRDLLVNYKTDGVRLFYGPCLIDLDTQIKLQVGLVTLRQGLDALCLALTGWTGDDPQGGTVTPTGGTVAAINAAKVLIDTVLE